MRNGAGVRSGIPEGQKTAGVIRPFFVAAQCSRSCLAVDEFPHAPLDPGRDGALPQVIASRDPCSLPHGNDTVTVIEDDDPERLSFFGAEHDPSLLHPGPFDEGREVTEDPGRRSASSLWPAPTGGEGDVELAAGAPFDPDHPAGKIRGNRGDPDPFQFRRGPTASERRPGRHTPPPTAARIPPFGRTPYRQSRGQPLNHRPDRARCRGSACRRPRPRRWR